MAAPPAHGHTSPAGQQEAGLLILVTVKPWSEWPPGMSALTVAAEWERRGAPLAAAALAAAALAGEQYEEFVTARSEKPGQDALKSARKECAQRWQQDCPKRVGS